MKLEARHQRPLQRLAEASEQWPAAWRQLEAMRESKGREGLPDWPAWCYLPIAAGYAVASAGADVASLSSDDRLDAAGHASPLTALAAWRISKGIWDFDPTLYRHLWETPVEGRLPTQVMYRLPEWCSYLCLRDTIVGGARLHGAFCWLESDANTGCPELRFALDADGTHGSSMPGLSIHLVSEDLSECLADAAALARANLLDSVERSPGAVADLGQLRASQAMMDALAPHLVSLALYLCSSEPDLTRPLPPAPGSGRRVSPRPQRDPTVWPVGVRIGAAIRAAEDAAPREPGDGSHASPRPHMRRAHWHGHWTGKRDSPEEKLALKWHPPTAVGVGEGPAVVHPVGE